MVPKRRGAVKAKKPVVRLTKKVPVPVPVPPPPPDSDNDSSYSESSDSSEAAAPSPPKRLRTRKATAAPPKIPEPVEFTDVFTSNPIEEVMREAERNTSKNIVHQFYGWEYGRSGKNVYFQDRINSLTIQNYIKSMDIIHTPTAQRFDRRITEISWHPKMPYLVGAACKGGDVVVLEGRIDSHFPYKNNCTKNDRTFYQIFGMKGRGPGGAIFAIRFDERNSEFMYIAGLEGTVQKWNLRTDNLEHQFYNTHNYNIWYTALDVSQETRTLLAGDTKGIAHLSTLDGEHVRSMKLHSGKILHCEFNPVVPHLIVTSSLDKTVKLWDLRSLNAPLGILPHDTGANVARFNPLKGNRILTSDQRDQIRVYQGPSWEPVPILTINHPHRQFQHLTPITANWHPKADIILIGRYPVVPRGARAPPRPIDFYSIGSELERFGLVHTHQNLEPFHELFHPINDIISINSFNPTGDMMASGQGRSLVLWKGFDISEKIPKPAILTAKKQKTQSSSLHFNAWRGPESGDSESDDDDPDSDDDHGAGASRRVASARNGKGVNNKKTNVKAKPTTSKNSKKGK